ncbi:MAG: MGMT family protein [Treponema sp.]|nr:MGMT family protein [Treponema sp.]
MKEVQSPNQSKNLAEIIYAAVRQIPLGKVATYSQVAALAGNCNLRRYVGNALHKNPSNKITPCHRVVNAKGFCSGSFSFGGPDSQREKLEAEGVAFIDGHVDLEKHLINDDDFQMMKAGLESEIVLFT